MLLLPDSCPSKPPALAGVYVGRQSRIIRVIRQDGPYWRYTSMNYNKRTIRTLTHCFYEIARSVSKKESLLSFFEPTKPFLRKQI